MQNRGVCALPCRLNVLVFIYRRQWVIPMRIPTSIDLFAGCGGLTRGLEWAGFECLAFNELNHDAADSFAANFPNAIRLDGDIRTALTPDVIQNTLLPLIEAKGGLDLLCGGPPCQGYSGIGHRRTHKLDRKDIPTNHLFLEMINAIEALQPRVFLFENVEGILSGSWITGGPKGEIFRDVWAAFSSITGYVAQPTLLHAYGFGVPQNRPRVMIMGIRTDAVDLSALDIRNFDPASSKTYASQLRNNGGLFPIWDEEVIAPDLIESSWNWIRRLDADGSPLPQTPFLSLPGENESTSSCRCGRSSNPHRP